MAIKDDIKVIKDELNTQEQILESMIKSERFLKKYKLAIIILATIGVIVLIAYYSLNKIEQNRIEKANLAYAKVLNNPNDKEALETLKKEAVSLYTLTQFKTFQENNDTIGIKTLINEPMDPILKQILSAYAGDGSGDILSNYDALLKGYELLKQDKINEANAEFSKIPADSPLINLVKNLQHYQGNKK